MAYSEVCLKQHILILGWSDEGTEIIRNLHSSDVQDPRQIVIVSDRHIFIDPTQEESRGVVIVPGDCADPNVLRMANAEKASGAIILAEGATVDEAVTRSLMVVLALRAITSDVYIVVEVPDESQRCHFEALGPIVNEIVCPGEYVSKMLAQAAVFPDSGVVDFYVHLLSQSPETNELYLAPCPTAVTGGDWLSVHDWLVAHADQDVIPIGYIRGDAAHDGAIVLSPGSHGTEELEYELTSNDQVVLIARSMPQFG